MDGLIKLIMPTLPDEGLSPSGSPNKTMREKLRIK